MIRHDSFLKKKIVKAFSLGYLTALFIFLPFTYFIYVFPYRTAFLNIDQTVYEFNFYVKPPNDNLYEIYFPIILEEDGTPSNVLYKIDSGKAMTLEIINSVKGYAGKIIADEVLEITAIYIVPGKKSPKLSLMEKSWSTIWVYSNSSGIEINLDFWYRNYKVAGDYDTRYYFIYRICDTTEANWKLMTIKSTLVVF